MAKITIQYLDERVIDQPKTAAVARAAREQAGITMERMAKELGITQPQVSYLENGKRNWTAATFTKFAAALERITQKKNKPDEKNNG